jgi:hypothetical protein
VPPPDILVVPSGIAQRGAQSVTDPFSDSAVRQWVQSQNILVKSFLQDPPGKAFPSTLDLVAQKQGAPITRRVATLLEYPWQPGPDIEPRSAWPLSYLYKAFVLGLLGVALAAWVQKRLLRR